MPSMQLVWDLIARDGASPTFARVGAAAEGASGAISGFLKTMGLVGAGAAVAAAVKSASDFNAKMALIQTQAGATAGEVRKMTPAILSLAGQVAQAPEALATSLYHVESTGLRGKAALEAVKIAAEGARVGHADLEQTTNALTATIASGMLPATETYAQAMGQLNTIVGSGDMKMEDLNQALGTGLLVTTKQYGITIQDVGAALADFGDNNIRGADAATMLRMAVQSIAKPGKDAGAALGQIGLTVGKLQSDEQTGGLNKALTDLHTHLVDSGLDASKWGQLMTDAFTKKAGAGIITLIGTFDRFESKYQEVSRGADSFGAAWTATTHTAAFQFAQLKDAADALGIRVGNVLLPVFSDTAHVLTLVAAPLGKVFELFGELPGPVEAGVLALGAFVALRGPLTSLFETVALKAMYMADSVAASVTSMAGLKAAGGGLLDMLGGPWGLAIAGATVGLGFLFSWLSKDDTATQQITQATQGYADALKAANGAIDDNVRQAAAKAALDSGLLREAQSLGISLPQVTDAITGQGTAFTQTRAQLEGYIKEHTHWQTTGHAAMQVLDGEGQAAQHALDALNRLSGQTKLSAADAHVLAVATGQTSDALAKNGLSTDALNKAMGATATSADIASGGLDLLGNAAGATQADMEDALKAIAAWRKQLQGIGNDFVNPLQTYEDLLSQKQQAEQQAAQATADATKSSKDSWKDYVKDVSVSLSDYAAQLEKQLTDQQNWQKNLVTIAQRGGYEVAQQFAAMGVQGATITAQMANATNADFTRMANDMAQKAQQGGQNAANNLDQAMRVMAEIGREGGSATAQAVATALGIGADQVAQIAAQYGINLAAGINPLLGALGKGTIYLSTRGGLGYRGQMWSGGYTGDGGKYEPKGVVHGGEFVFTKEQTAAAGVDSLYALANMLSGYSGGGYVSPSDVPHPYSTAPFGVPLSTGANATMQKEYDVTTAWLAQNSNNPYAGMVAGATSQAAVQLGARMAAAVGWTGEQWTDLVKLWIRESGWNPYAVNPSSGAYGIPQSLGHGHPYNLGDSAAQIAWGINYIQGRYGNPANAWAHEMSAGWYDNGGYLMPGLTMAYNGTGKPERIRTAEQEAALGSGQPTVVGMVVQGNVHADPDQLAYRARVRTQQALAMYGLR